MTKAKFTQRTLAYAIDLSFIALMQVILGGATIKFYEGMCAAMHVEASFDTASFLSQFCGAFFFIGYFTFVQGFWGMTIGKRFAGIRVVNAQTNKPLGIKESYWRALAYVLSSWTYCIGFILPLFRKDQMTLHDLLCNTQVVTVKATKSNFRLLESSSKKAA